MVVVVVGLIVVEKDDGPVAVEELTLDDTAPELVGVVVWDVDDTLLLVLREETLVVDTATGPTEVAEEFKAAPELTDVLELTAVLELTGGVTVRVCVMTRVELTYSVDVE